MLSLVFQCIAVEKRGLDSVTPTAILGSPDSWNELRGLAEAF